MGRKVPWLPFVEVHRKRLRCRNPPGGLTAAAAAALLAEVLSTNLDAGCLMTERTTKEPSFV